MSDQSPWEPKPLHDEHPWSLIPNCGLSKKAAHASLAAWIGVVALAAAFGLSSWQSLIAGAFVGAWAVHYVGARLGGRPAITGGASAPIRFDSPFQARLAFDVIALVVLATAVYLVGFKA
jgi:hypothetical protein